MSMALVGIVCDYAINARAAEPERTTEGANPLVLRLGQPQHMVMSGQPMRSLISGKVLIVDKDYEPAPGIKIHAQYWGDAHPKSISSPEVDGPRIDAISR
jgi:hypothetical protein